jgi:hypothetical protein
MWHKFPIAIAFFGFALIATPNAICQPSRSGGAEAISPQAPSMSEPYGINSTEGTSSVGGAADISRHHRFGRETGIGSSYAQTQSTTSEEMAPLREPRQRPETPALTPTPEFAGSHMQRTGFSELMRRAPSTTFEHVAEGVQPLNLTSPGFQSVNLNSVMQKPYQGFSLEQLPLSGLGRGSQTLTIP